MFAGMFICGTCSLRPSNPSSFVASWALAAGAAAAGERGNRVGGAIVIMSLRALGSLLGRRFSLRGMPRARAQAQEETLGLALHRPLRSLHILRDLDIVDGSIGALAAAGGMAALVLYSYGALEVSSKEIDMKRPPVDDPAIRAKFVGEDGKVAWVQYRDYIHFLMLHPEVNEHDEMIQRRYPRGPTTKLENVKTEEHEGMSIDEPAMKARFDEWMKQFGRTYKNEDEKAMRYEIFKACAIRCDKANASALTKASARFAPMNLADRTHEEIYGPCCQIRQVDDSYWEKYFSDISDMYAKGLIEGYPRTVDADQKVGWIDAAKQWYKVYKSKKLYVDAARKAEQAAATSSKGGC